MEFDGDMDVILATDSDLSWWENTGSGTVWVRHDLPANLNSGYGVYAKDVDGDGDLDISVADLWHDEFLWFENLDSLGTVWTEHVLVGTLADGPTSSFLEDIDGDGDVDMLVGGCGGLGWFENMDGAGSSPWTEHVVETSFNFAIHLTAFDFDGDGDMDLAGAAYSDNALAWWENLDGVGGSFERHDVAVSYEAPGSASYADFDLDGDLDFLSESYGEDNVTIWENMDGDGTYWRKVVIQEDFSNPGEAFAADIDGDGDIDAIASAYTGGEILWWEMARAPGEGFLDSSILYAGEYPEWEWIDWEAESGGETTYMWLQVRASEDPEDMGDWSDSLFQPTSIEYILTPGDSYFQYRVTLGNTGWPGGTPILNEVSVNWNATGCYESPNPVVPGLSIFPNPSQGAPSVRYTAEAGIAVELTVYDLAGRVVLIMAPETLGSGSGSIQLEDCIPGIYLCRLTAEGNEIVERFVVVD